LAGLRNPLDQWVSLLRSRTVADAMIERFQLRTRYEVEMMFEARKELAGNTRICGGKDNLITIEVDDHDPRVAAEMANAYVDELLNLSKTLAVTEAAQRRLFFERQLA
jgi:tyrosine-protein kinase Etk/Wzc